MKALLSLVIVLGSFSAQAEVVTRTERTGNDRIIAVGHCGVPNFNAQQNTASSYFAYSVCSEVKTFQAEKTSGSVWSVKYAPIAGTEKLSYKIEMRENGDTRTESGNGLAIVEATLGCSNLRSATAQAVVPVSSTGCANQ